MTNKLTRPLDPEFAAVFAQAEKETSPQSSRVQGRSQQSATPIYPVTEDDETEVPQTEVVELDDTRDSLLELKRIAEENQRLSGSRKQYADGSFDQIEHDVSNVVKTAFDFLTR